MSKRLFIGLELPSGCREMLAGLDPEIYGLRWLPAKQLHLTVCFLGAVEPESERRLRESLATLRVPPFFLPIRGVGTFGGVRPSVIWAGVGTGDPRLFALHRQILEAVSQAGLAPDPKPFHPHITLGRAKNVSFRELLPFLHRYAETEFALWRVDGFALFSSLLTPEGATHLVEMRC